jgi:peroxiredoxin
MKTRYLLCVVFSLCLAQAGQAADSTEQTLPRVEKPFAAPDFSLTGEDGKTYHLADYRGQVVVINFWATWCPPCRREMPSMQRMWSKIKGKGVVVLAVNVGENADIIFEFLGQYPVSFPIPMDLEGKVVKRYPVTGLPTTYIVNPEGMVTHRAVGSREWDDPALYGRLLQMRKH